MNLPVHYPFLFRNLFFSFCPLRPFPVYGARESPPLLSSLNYSAQLCEMRISCSMRWTFHVTRDVYLMHSCIGV